MWPTVGVIGGSVEKFSACIGDHCCCVADAREVRGYSSQDVGCVNRDRLPYDVGDFLPCSIG